MINTGLYNQQYYKKQEFCFKSKGRADHKRILEVLNVNADDKVLEIGCGFGVLLEKIPAKKKIGIETNEVAIRECRKRGLSVIKADAEKKLPCKNSSFNIIIMNEVIEHLRKTEFVLKECFRILTPGGRIIITSPNRSFFASDLSSTHFSEMTIKELRELVQKSGFKILRHEVRDFSFLYPLLDNFFFKPFRFLRYVLGKEKQEKPVELIDSCHALADRTLLRPLSSYRKYFLRIGLNQLILAQKNR